MFRTLLALTLSSFAVASAACGSSDRHAQSPSSDATGGAGPGVTSGSPAEPDTFVDPVAKPPSSRNPARRPSRQSEEDLLALRSSLFSAPSERVASERAQPSQASGGGGGTAGSGGMAPVASGGAASGGIVNRSGGPSFGGRATSGGALSLE